MRATDRERRAVHEHVDLSGLQAGESLRLRVRYELDLRRVAEDRDGNGVTEVDVESLPLAGVVRRRESGSLRDAARARTPRARMVRSVAPRRRVRGYAAHLTGARASRPAEPDARRSSRDSVTAGAATPPTTPPLSRASAATALQLVEALLEIGDEVRRILEPNMQSHDTARPPATASPQPSGDGSIGIARLSNPPKLAPMPNSCSEFSIASTAAFGTGFSTTPNNPLAPVKSRFQIACPESLGNAG